MDFLSSGLNILLIILGFGLLIFVHELGHFITAKWAGIRTEAFAVGMGPVMIAWRKGIGFRFGSTAAAYEKRVREHLQSQRDEQIQINEKVEGAGELPAAEMYRIGDKIGLGETEYSLRWLPLGGFVKMLGQEDANPNAVSDDPRSYQKCPVGKRMIVVSAGVIMNILLALLLFIIAFMKGVEFDAPVVGDVAMAMPASQTRALNAKEVGVDAIGLQPGDTVVSIDGDPARTFADVQIASAMSKPGVPIELTVQRAGIDEPLRFSLLPQKDRTTGLLGVGVYPGSSTTLDDDDDTGLISLLIDRAGLAGAGVKPGMTLLSVNDQPISTYGQLDLAANQANGQPLQTVWAQLDEQGQIVGEPIHAIMATQPALTDYMQRDQGGDPGLLGLSPLTEITTVLPGSPNVDALQPGDVIVKIGSISYPRRSQFFDALQANKRGTLSAIVRRDGIDHPVQLKVSKKGELQVGITMADDLLVTAQPISTYSRYREDDPSKIEDVPTPIQAANLVTSGGTTIEAVNGQRIATWAEFRQALRAASASALAAGQDATMRLEVTHPTPEQDQEEVAVTMSPADVKQLHALGWSVELPSSLFTPIQVTLNAGGNPLKAITMGLAETRKLVTMTYLTIDRLIRGSVGVDQLRGPVGIIHIGTKVADRGFMYTMFFLGMISVNLAVINFLPIPIVDGGLFLFLVYEKFKGRPPSLAFQNAATLVGLFLIGTLFIVTFYNDVLRLLN